MEKLIFCFPSATRASLGPEGKERSIGDDLASSVTMTARVSQRIIMRDNIGCNLNKLAVLRTETREVNGTARSRLDMSQCSKFSTLDSLVQLQTGDHRESSLDINNANALRVLVVGCRWVYLYIVRSIAFVNLSQLQDTSRVCFVDGSGQAGPLKKATTSFGKAYSVVRTTGSECLDLASGRTLRRRFV